MYKYLSILAVLGMLATVANSQTTHSYTTFNGEVYDIPLREKNKEFGPHFLEFPKIGELNWTKIHVTERYIEDGFPGVPREQLFFIDFRSRLTVFEEGCYQFFLKSDDGSRVWINDHLIVDNTGEDQRLGTADTVYLKKDTYPVKVWYNQIYPDRFGVIFSSKKVEGECGHKKKITSKKPNQPANTVSQLPIGQKITLSPFLFKTNEHTLKPGAYSKLNSICNQIRDASPASILIVGHTDNVGQPDTNLQLSLNRASTIRDYMITRINLPNIQYTFRGMGEQQPVADNNTKDGRQANRRVEVILK